MTAAHRVDAVCRPTLASCGWPSAGCGPWTQATTGTAVSRADLQPVDLVLHHSSISHVSVYAGDGQTVHASALGTPVEVMDMDSMGGVTAMRRIA